MSALPRVVAVVACLLVVSCSSTESTVDAGETPTTVDIRENPEGGRFRLLSYNVGGLPVEISEGRPDLNLPIIGERLSDYEVVMTQEDYDWWLPDGLASTVDFVNYHGRLRAASTHTYQSPRHPGPEAVGIDLAVRPELLVGDGLGLMSNLDVSGDERVPWTECFGGLNQDDGGKGDCLSMKGFQVAQLTLPNGATVHLYNMNVEAGSAPEDQALQADDLEQIAEHIAQNAGDDAVIVAGTTNMELDTEDRALWAGLLEAAGLTDACEVEGCSDDAPLARGAFRSGADVDLTADAYGFPSDRFLDDDGQPLSYGDPLEISFTWSAA